jgi:chromosomal replication initiator protein
VFQQHQDDNSWLPTVDAIQKEVAAHFGVTRLDLISGRRNRDLAHARQVAMWIARHTTAHSLPAIGRYFGKRDHTTVLYAIRCVDRRRAEDDDLEGALRGLMEKLRPVQRTALLL